MKSLKTRALIGMASFAAFIATSPFLWAQENEAETTSDPIWVLSYAAFIFFAGLAIMICIFFSKRRETALDLEQQRAVAKKLAERIKAKRDEERRRMLHGKR